MKAIILAAGRSSRLYPITIERPKCLLEIGGKRIIDRQIEAVNEIGIKEIVVVVGYKKDIIIKEVGDAIVYREYKGYEQTNNLHTLWSIRDLLNDDYICLFSDVVFEPGIIKMAKESTEDFCMIIDTKEILEGTMRVEIEKEKLKVIGSHVPLSAASGNFIGIAKFSKIGSRMLLDQMGEMISGHQNDYYTIAVDALVQKGTRIGYIDVKNSAWTEVDTQEDLEIARRIFS